MGDFLDEMNSLMAGAVGSGSAGKPGLSYSDEIGQLLTGPAQAPPSGVQRRLPGVVGGVDMIAQWVERNPREAAHMLIQGGVSAAGTAGGGFVGGPPGAVAGGAAGNYLGDVIGRAVTGQDMPGLVDSAVDLGVGAAGPMVAAAPRALGRAMVGANATVRREAGEAGFNALLSAPRAGGPVGAELATTQAQRDALAAAQSGVSWAGRVFDISMLGPAAYSMFQGNLPNAAMLLAGGASASYARRAIAERLLKSQRFIDFVLRPDVGSLQTTAGILGAAAGAEGQRFLTDEEQGMARSLMGPEPERTLGGRQRRATPFDKILTPQGAPIGRDRRTGRFMAIGDEDNG